MGPVPLIYRNSHKAGQSSRPTVLYKWGGHTSKALLAILGSRPGTRSSPPKGHLFLSFSLLREKGGKCAPALGVPVVRGRLVPSAQVTEMNGWPGLSPRPTAGL